MKLYKKSHYCAFVKIRKRNSFCQFFDHFMTYLFYFMSGISRYFSSTVDTVHWRKQMCKKHKCFREFIGSLNAESSQETYGYKMQKFMKEHGVDKSVWSFEVTDEYEYEFDV